MKNCKYEKRYPHTNKHIKYTRDGSLRCKGCWSSCAHATKPLLIRLLRRLSLWY